ncbi:efflux RND transporter permease subunit [Peribacillus simplex]|uniref:Efflux RND transporter permease subunit n=1 Tax=Peribacillus simplex TaxID=1478 RepID=A0AAW7I745_9BACI|nr:efflux RND transporter permease subunit [Peribacillus simplex]AMM91403.1 Swarming motility protein SwrC [Peribacillus simplex]MDM5292008.1 efflux RND transporter permease subunit [Peribacillus simplex]MDM5450833.1 efflux RND transporter permease subunit [Peribacillus simplex]
MNSIIKFSLKNKLAIWLLTIIIVAAGLYSGLNMKQETIPNISTPLISISTVYPGAAPEEVADKLTNQIEQKVTNLSGVELVSSSSMANVSSIQLQYDYDTDMDDAVKAVKEALEKIELPEGVDNPSVSKLELNAFPVVALSVTDKDSDLPALTKNVEEVLVPKLEGIDGVTSVSISGQQVNEGSLVFDQEKMAQYGLDEETVKKVIQAANINMPLGIYNFDDKEKTIVVDGNISTLKDLKNIKIPLTGGSKTGTPAQTIPETNQLSPEMASGTAQVQNVKLSDIADVKVTGKAESVSRTNGSESIGIQVTRSPDADTVAIVDEVNKEISNFKEEFKGVSVHTTLDQAKPIKDSVETMISKAIFGCLFAVIVIMLFLRNFKTTLISVISIPLSLLAALLVLKQMDISLNVMTLGAMTVAIGRVVDDSIVVIENIYRRMALKGEQLKGGDLIRSATKEMFIPILSSTIVTVAVYLPLASVTGAVGELFMPFALTMVFALVASLIIAITLVPAMADSLFKKGLSKKELKSHEEKPSKLSAFYRKALDWSLNHKLITFGTAIVLLVGSLFLIPSIGVSFMPADEEKTIIVTYTPAPGELKEDIEKQTEKVEKYFIDKDDVKTVQYTLGENMMSGMMGGSGNSALFYVLYDEDTKNFGDKKEKVIKDLTSLNSPGTWKQQEFTSTSSNETTLYVYGNTQKEIEPVIDDIKNIMKKNKDLKDVDTSLSDAYEQYTLVADQKKLSDLGLTAAQIGMSIANTNKEDALTTIKKDGEEVKVYVETEETTFKDKKDLENTKISSPMGMKIPLKELVKIEEGKASDTISRRDGKIYADVSATIKSDDVAAVTAEVQKEVKKLDLPASVSVDYGGVTKDIQESFTQLGIAMLAAIAIVYFVLVVTFHGGLAPIAILFSLPFTVIGALAGLFVTGETISVSAMMGVLMLIGIVVTNAIVLVDRVIKNEESGLSTREALLEAGSTRLRPILMTALATIGALIPLAIGAEGSGLISQGLGITVIGGLVSSTLLTLVIVPVVYEVIMKIGKKKKKTVK